MEQIKSENLIKTWKKLRIVRITGLLVAITQSNDSFNTLSTLRERKQPIKNK